MHVELSHAWKIFQSRLTQDTQDSKLLIFGFLLNIEGWTLARLLVEGLGVGGGGRNVGVTGSLQRHCTSDKKGQEDSDNIKANNTQTKI